MFRDWKNYAPWLVDIQAGEIRSLALKMQSGEWSIGPGDIKTLAEWHFQYLAAIGLAGNADVPELVEKWKEETLDSLMARPSSVLPPALWLLRNAKESEMVEAERILNDVAFRNFLPRAPDSVTTPVASTLGLTDKDARLVWHVLFMGIGVHFEPPLMSVWSPDPFAAKWCMRKWQSDQLSTLCTLSEPFIGDLTVGVYLPGQYPRLSSQYIHRVAERAIVVS